MRKINVATASGSYTVSIGSGLLDSLSKHLRTLFGDERKSVYVLTSPEIWSLWGRRFLASFPSEPPIVLFLPAGESHKRLSRVERLASDLVEAGADRSSLLIAFGGGVIGDVGGFVSAIYMRGIDYIQIPTTLLAQVDSSVGGKTGVNLAKGKNLIGSFHHPAAVLADTGLLATLPKRELRAGLYESIKTGLIRDAKLFRYIEANAQLIDQGDSKRLEMVVTASVKVKAEVVGLDEKESGLRMILNFGHTIGHAIEATTGFGKLLHGEAIAWGMLVALEISRNRGWLTGEDARQAAAVIQSFEPPPLPAIKSKRLLQAASRDKKNRGNLRHFVLLKGLGNAVVADDVTDHEVLAALDAVRGLSRRRK